MAYDETFGESTDVGQSPQAVDRTKGLRQDELYFLYDELLDEVIKLASLVEDADVELVDLRHSLAQSFSTMKACVTLLAGHGHQPFFEKLGEFTDYVTQLIESCYHEAAQRVLIEEFSAHFTLTREQLSLASHVLPGATSNRLYEQVLSGSLDPSRDACDYWADWQDEFGLHAMMSTFRVLGPPTDAQSAIALSRMVRLISEQMQSNREQIPSTVDIFVANMSVMSPIMEGLTTILDQQRDSPTNFVRALALPAEFLAELWKETRQSWVKQFFELTTAHPKGYLPFTFYEELGKPLDNAWHQSAQANAAGEYLFFTIEHAMMVPGSLIADDHPGLTSLDTTYLTRLVEIINRAVDVPEAKAKAQKLVDQMIIKADRGFKMPLMAYLMNELEPVYFASHNAILGKTFSKDLGL